MESYGSSGKGTLQESMRLGKAMDIYYYTSDTTHKQSIPTIVDTRFYQDLTSLGAGSSTFIISVDQGISDVILSASLPEADGTVVDYTGLVLPRGWLYQAINRISVRYGSSSQYFWTGQQMMIENLREMPNPTTRDDLFSLGGANMMVAGDFTGNNLSAYAYINLPHNSPCGSMGKPNPFPSELIGQPIVITVELNSLPSLFSATSAAALATAPQVFKSAYFQVRQIHAKESSDLMTMSGGRSSAYSFPLKAFYQNEVQNRVGKLGAVGAPSSYQIQLTGFRNGEVRSIFFWITKDSDVSPASAVVPIVKNFTNFILPSDVELMYNGTVYYRARGTSSQMWSLITTETPPLLNCTLLSAAGENIGVVSKPANWVEIPFGQVFEQLSGSHLYVAGKLIQNAVVNLTLTLPDEDAYTIHSVYSYNAALMFSDKACEYVF